MLKARTALLCTVVIAGCAGNGSPKELMPINGQCSPVKDMCLMGAPTDTGDTSSPYGWTCMGRYGGASDTCSVPTAPLENDEVFAGQNALVDRIKATGPLRGRLALLDWTWSSFDATHAKLMREDIVQMGIPDENLVMVGEDPEPFLRQFYQRDTSATQRREFRGRSRRRRSGSLGA